MLEFRSCGDLVDKDTGQSSNFAKSVGEHQILRFFCANMEKPCSVDSIVGVLRSSQMRKEN